MLTCPKKICNYKTHFRSYSTKRGQIRAEMGSHQWPSLTQQVTTLADRCLLVPPRASTRFFSCLRASLQWRIQLPTRSIKNSHSHPTIISALTRAAPAKTPISSRLASNSTNTRAQLPGSKISPYSGQISWIPSSRHKRHTKIKNLARAFRRWLIRNLEYLMGQLDLIVWWATIQWKWKHHKWPLNQIQPTILKAHRRNSSAQR